MIRNVKIDVDIILEHLKSISDCQERYENDGFYTYNAFFEDIQLILGLIRKEFDDYVKK